MKLMKEFKEKLLLVDGHALLYRAYHALPNLSNSKGFPTGAIFGFFSMLLKALEDIKPSHALVVFDVPGKTFRDEIAGDYKAHRKPTPDDLTLQLPRVKEILNALDIPVYEKPGYEADDIIGIITRLSPKDVLNIVVTGDMDLLQLINKNTVVYRFKVGFTDVVIYDEDEMKKQYNLTPSQWVDLKSIKGDASDNIPGVPGIGEKGALDLIQKFGSLEKVYAAAEKSDKNIKPATIEKLMEGKVKAFLSQRLAHIDTSHDFPEFDFEKTKIADYDQQKVIELFSELNIKSLIPKLPKLTVKAEKVLQAKQEKHDYQIVDTADKLDSLIRLLEKQKGFAIDTETTRALPMDAELIGISFAVKENQSFYVPTYQKPEMQALTKLKKILEDPKIEKWGHNLKSDALVLKKYGVSLRPLSFDTLIAAYLLNPGLRNYDIAGLGLSEFGFRKTELTDFEGKDKIDIPFDQVELTSAANYSCEDVDLTFRLKKKFEGELESKKLRKIFEAIEMPLVPVLMQMEERGIKLDTDYLEELGLEAGKQLKKLEREIHKLAGMEFNISSPIQLREVLFDKLQIPTTAIRKKGKTGAISTAATELEKLRDLHPIIDHIFDYRELSKLKSTYLDALPKLVSVLDKRLHTTYTQTIAATGRLSSSDPNLQNIPVRTELGRRVRKAFVAQKGFVLASLDYSQIELRIAASLSGDPEMVKIFKSGKDFHLATAARIFNVMESNVSFEQRRDAKTINFSVLYGVSAFGLSERSTMARAEAGDFIKRYYQVFSKLKEYIDKQIKQAHDTGMTVNPLGRIRYYPDINSTNFAVRAAAERAAVNAPIQSLSADIIKLAMIEIQREVLDSVSPRSNDNNLRPSSEAARGEADVRMLLQVHDELVFEIKEGKEQEYIPKIKMIMESVYKLKVPIVVEAKVGQNWLDMEKIA